MSPSTKVQAIFVFVVSTGLQLLFMFAYHLYHIADRLFPTPMKNANKKRIAVKPTLYVPEEHLVAIPALKQSMEEHFCFFFHTNASASQNQVLLWPN